MAFNKINSSKNVIEIKSTNKNLKSSNLDHKYHLKDKMMKQITSKRVNALFKRLDIPFVIKNVYPIEVVYGDVLRRLDFVGETINGELINLEFQSNKVNQLDIESFGVYALLLRIIYEKQVHSVILLTPNITTENVIEYHINNKNSYEMFTASLKDFDGEEIRDKLKIKIKNNQKFTEQDVMDFVLTPLMKIDNSIVDFIRENVNLVKKIKASQEDILFMESMLLMEIDNFVQDNELNRRIKGELRMKLSIIDEIVDDIMNEGIAEGRIEGIAEGIENTKLQVAKDMLKEGYSEEEILKISKITSKQLLTLLNI